MRYSLFLVAISAVACADPPIDQDGPLLDVAQFAQSAADLNVHFSVTRNLSVGQLDALRQASEFWSGASGGRFVPSFDGPSDPICGQDSALYFAQPGTCHLSAPGAGSENVVGYYSGNKIITLSSALDPHGLYLVTVHEIGHMLGLDHSGTGFMYPNIAVANEWLGSSQLNQVAARYGWSLDCDPQGYARYYDPQAIQ